MFHTVQFAAWPFLGRDAAMIDDRSALGMGEVVPFGRRPIPPRACVLENKTHVRTFLAEMLDELGFIAREAVTLDIRTMLRDFRPDLIVLGPLNGGPEVRSVMQTLRAQGYGAKIMLFGGRSSAALIRNYEFGEAAGLTMLPPLGTPFRDRDLHANLGPFLPVRPAPPLPVDVDSAVQRLAGALVPVKNKSALACAARSRSTRAYPPSHLGRGGAGLLHSRRERSVSSW